MHFSLAVVVFSDFRALKNALLKNNTYHGNNSVTPVFEFVGAELIRYIYLQIIFCSWSQIFQVSIFFSYLNSYWVGSIKIFSKNLEFLLSYSRLLSNCSAKKIGAWKKNTYSTKFGFNQSKYYLSWSFSGGNTTTGNCWNRFSGPDKRPEVVKLYELSDEDSARWEKLLQSLNVIIRVLSSWRQKVSVTSDVEL